MTAITLEPISQSAISYTGPHPDGYTGIFILRGDVHWRQCRNEKGQLVFHPTIAEAEADAAHRFIAAINTIDLGTEKPK